MDWIGVVLFVEVLVGEGRVLTDIGMWITKGGIGK